MNNSASIMNKQVINKERKPINLHKFMMWLIVISIIMVFAAFTSAYIVRKAALGWRQFPIPTMFTWSTIVIVISSITLHLGSRAIKKANESLSLLYIAITFTLGLVFLFLQLEAWGELELNFGGENSNVSSDFLYLLSALHLSLIHI